MTSRRSLIAPGSTGRLPTGERDRPPLALTFDGGPSTLTAQVLEMGNHSHSHPDFTRISDEQADEETTRTNATITAATGATPQLFRYPFGRGSGAGNDVLGCRRGVQ